MFGQVPEILRRQVEVDRAQQAHVGVIEYVAVEDPCTRALVETHRQTDRSLVRDVHRVLPLQGADRIAGIVQDHEEEAVQMHRP